MLWISHQDKTMQRMIRSTLFRVLLVCAPAAVLLGGCMVGPNFERPKVGVPENWIGADAAAATQPSVAVAQGHEIVEWWTTFNDPTLNSLVGRAVESNLDLKIAAARVRQARAVRAGASAGLWPTVDTSASYSRSRAGGQAQSGLSGGARSLFRAGLDAAWELDIFGGIRRGIEAADADVQAAVEDRRDVLVTLAAEVALDYMDLRGLQRELAIAKENLEAQKRSAALTRERFAGGFVRGLDVANSDAQVATTQSQIPLIESDLRQVIYALGVLLGREPGALLQELSAEAPIPGVPPQIPIGLPSDLLRRRPDIRRAEAEIAGATARIGVATADLFPKFSLTGSLGLSGSELSALGNWGNRSWSFGPSVSWPLFDAGRIRANIEVQNAAQEQALLAYRATVLTALQDVENALIAFAKEQEHRKSLSAAVTANRRAVDLATQLYRQGNTDFLNVLSAQRSLLLSEDALVQSDRTVAANLVALYKALGGGWEIESQGEQAP
jgi:NodT family efflux transporter outer membrane factor (OMF) lipoprotein